jgi:hypothetical protein
LTSSARTLRLEGPRFPRVGLVPWPYREAVSERRSEASHSGLGEGRWAG